MKFDKTVVLVFALGAGLIIGWPQICRKLGWMPEATPQQHAMVAHGAPIKAPKVKTVDSPVVVAAKVKKKTKVEPAGSVDGLLAKYPEKTIANKQLSVKISPVMGFVTQTTLKQFKKSDLKTDITIGGEIARGALGVSTANTDNVVEIVTSKLVTPSSYLLKRKIAVNGGVILLTQRWSLVEGYRIDCQVDVKNIGGTTLNLDKFAVSGYAMQPLHQLSGDVHPRRETHGIDYLTVNHNFNGLNASDKKLQVDTDAPIVWFGAANKYFAGIVKAVKPFDELAVKRVKRQADGDAYYVIMARGIYNKLTIEPNVAERLSFTAFCGPKEFSLLQDFAPQATKMLHMSWGPLDTIARWLLRFLIWLNAKCGSWGLSIIILTMIVRLLFWPVTQKANKSMKKMQQLQPLVAELKAKYKDNPQVMNSKVMELYREKHVSPLGGCLPILLQIPVFFALYATLGSAVELRHASFLWATDLSRPDTIATIAGFAINPLVIAMTLLMVVQQKLTPMSGDPIQKKMMMFMPLIMLIFLYHLPSGLTLYWTVSQIFSIFQLLINQKFDGKNNETVAVATK